MQDQQVGDTFVLRERQAQRRFGVDAGLSVPVHTVDVAINTLHMAIHVTVHTIHSIRGVVSLKDKKESMICFH